MKMLKSMIYNHCNIVYDVELHEDFIYMQLFLAADH